VTSAEPLTTDLVLEGGGVKGLALVGAVEVLGEAGYSFARVGGTSAGALVGAVVAALQTSGEDLQVLRDVALTLDYRKFRDRGLPLDPPGPLGILADAVSVVVEEGAYEGDYLRDWLRGVLADLGVSTFGDLRRDDDGDDGGMHHRYGLVVTASDLSRRRLVKLPWDYPDYGLDPDEQDVVDAVRASASIPFFYEPVQLRGVHGTSTLVDGGLVSNYPVSIFDREDGRVPRWPTIGVRLDALNLSRDRDVSRVRGPVAIGAAIVATAIEACQAEHVLSPANVARSITVSTDRVSAVDFGLSREEQLELRQAGAAAAEAFLAGWDWQAWLRDHRGGGSSPDRPQPR
jgi:NTE family protein